MRWLELVYGAGDGARPDTLGGPTAFLKTARTDAERVALEREIEVARSVFHDAHRAVWAHARGPGVVRAAFEHVEGTPLHAHLAARPDDATRAAIALLRALRALHQRELVHGDLKPEHVIIEGDGRLRLIDLGLAAPIGTTARGGSHGYLAPELLAGEVVQPASDLYAFGRVMAAIERPPERLAQLIARCCSEAAADRPPSTEAALAMLGAPSGASVSAPEIATSAMRDAMRAMGPGAIVVIDVPRGGGRSMLARWLREALADRGPSLRVLPTTADPWARLAARLAIDGEPAVTASRATRAVLGTRDVLVPLLVDGADQLGADGRAALLWAARLVTSERLGALIVMGPDAELTASLAELRPTVIAVPPLTRAQIAAVLAAHDARNDGRTIAAVDELSAGRAGWAHAIARRLGEAPELAVADAWHPPEAPRAAPPLDPAARIAEARAAIASGAPVRACELLEGLAGREVDVLRAHAELRANRLERAAATLARLEAEGPDDERERLALIRARTLERLARHAEARAVAEPITMKSRRAVHRAAAASIAAPSVLSLGTPAEADALAAAGLAALEADDDEVPDLASPEPSSAMRTPEARRAAVKARLIATRSDAALRAHDPAAALRLAADARAEAERTGDALAIAHAMARSAAAHALSGDPRRARVAWRAALDHAEASGDLSALPPYVMNLATADHALHELGDAIAGYERAAELAGRLGRAGSRAAALTNLGGLLGTIGADAEATLVLDDAERAATEAGAPLYAAQCRLFRAEVLSRRDPAAAAVEVGTAATAFVERGASRQATEAALCAAEIELARGDGAAALTRLAALVPTLPAAGLGARGALLEARARMLVGELAEARRAADSAAADARASDDLDLVAQALGVLGEIHDRLGTGAGAGLRSEARTLLGQIAARLPAGLRESFLAHPARRPIATAVAEASTPIAARGLSDASRRLLALVSRLLVEEDEQRLLETALDEAVALTRAERAFLLLRPQSETSKRPEVVAARNLDRETIQKSRFRWSRSVAERVLETGEPLVTASATEDPALMGSRSVLDLGLRSILSVPVRSRAGVVGALYLDHRFEKGRFGDEDRELVQALADVIGLALRSGRLLREARSQKAEIERLYEAAQDESARKDVELHRLSDALRKGAVSDVEEVDTGGLIGRSPALYRALEVARKVAPSDLSILIEGESGTGKELLARFVHDHGPRSAGPWVALNCGALPESILESELFGHQRGAFTGAVRDHLGVFRAANGGTVFLDEIGELPPGAQVRLLRVLQEREVQPVGGRSVVKVDVRVIAATHRHLSDEVEAGRFRRDLYFRLVGATLTLPPLRERPEDVPLIAARLLARIAREPGMREVELGRSAMAALARHDWPGNVRELEQTLRRAVVVAEGAVIEASDLGIGAASLAPSRREAHASLEREVIEQALRREGGNRTLAAAALGISRVTLHRLTKRLGIDMPVKMGRPPSRRAGR